MNKIISAMLTIVLLLCSVSVSAKPKEEMKEFDIQGYGNIILHKAFSPSLWEKEFGPNGTTFYSSDDETFSIGLVHYPVQIIVMEIDDIVQSVMINFQNLILYEKDLDDITCLIIDIHQMYLDKYDDSLIFFDHFNFSMGDWETLYTGILDLKDLDEDECLINWDGYDLSIVYMTKEAWAEAEKYSYQSTKDQQDKI